MRASLAILVGASLVLAGCDEQLTGVGALAPNEGLPGACAALVAAQAGVPTESVAIGGTGVVNGNMIARVPGSSTAWICEVRNGNRIVGVYPSNQPSRNVITNQTTGTSAPVYRVQGTQVAAGQTFTSQGRTYRVVSPGTVQQSRTVTTQPQTLRVTDQTFTPRTVRSAPQTVRVTTQGRPGQTEYRTLSGTTQVRTAQPQTYRVVTQQPTTQTRVVTQQTVPTQVVTQPRNCLFGNCRTRLGPAVPNQPTYAGGAEPTYHQPLYSDTRTGATRVGNRIEYVVPSQSGVNF